MVLRKFDKILLILDVKFKTIMMNKNVFVISEQFIEISKIILKFLKILENLKNIQEYLIERLVNICQYLPMNRHLYLY